MALSLLHTISPLLTFDASSWLCIKLIYGALLFNTIPVSLISPVIFSHWNTLCFSCSTHLSVCTLGHSSKKIASLTVSNLPDLLPSLFWFFLFCSGCFFFFTSLPFCGSQKLTAVTFESLPLHSKFKAKDIKTVLWQWPINTFCMEENDSKKTKIIIGPDFGPTHIALWFPTTIVVSSMYLIPILPF